MVATSGYGMATRSSRSETVVGLKHATQVDNNKFFYKNMSSGHKRLGPRKGGWEMHSKEETGELE